MPFNEDQQRQLEVEVIVRDSFSAALKAMARELDIVNKKAQEAGTVGSKAWENFRKQMDGIDEQGKKSNRTLLGFSDLLGRMPKQMLGAFGVAAAIYEVGKALTAFTFNQQSIRVMAADAGYATDAFRKLVNVFEYMDGSSEKAKESVVNFGRRVNDLRINETRSQIYRELVGEGSTIGMIGGTEFGKRLIRMVRGGAGADELLPEFSRAYGEQKAIFDAATAEGRKDTANNARRVMGILEKASGLTAYQLEHFEEYRDRAIAGYGITPEDVKKQQEAYEALIDLRQKFWVNLEAAEAAGARKIVRTADLLLEGWRNLFGSLGGLSFEKLKERAYEKPEQPKGSDKALTLKEIWERGTGPTEKMILDREKNKSLHEILETLKRQESPISFNMPTSGPSSAGGEFPGAPGTAPSAGFGGPPAYATPPAWPSGATAPFTPTPSPPQAAPAPAAPAQPSAFQRFRSFLGRAFSREGGGPVTAGTAYTVGEGGAEMVVPKRRRVSPIAAAIMEGVPDPTGGRGVVEGALSGYESFINWINQREIRDSSGRAISSAQKSRLMRLHEALGIEAESALDLTPIGSWMIFGHRLGRYYFPKAAGEDDTFNERYLNYLQQLDPDSVAADRNRLSGAIADRSRRKAGAVNAVVDFGDMPNLGGDTGRSVFLPISLNTAPKAAKASIIYDKWGFQ